MSARRALVLLLAALIAGCSGDGPGAPPPARPRVATVTVAPDTLRLTVGRDGPLSVAVRDSAGNVLSGRSVTWRSATPTTATVDSGGRVTAVALGTSQVTATVDGVSASAAVLVSLPTADSVRLEQDSAVVRVGGGSSVIIRRGEIPAGSWVSLTEIATRPADAPAGPGPAWQVAIRPPEQPGVAAPLLVATQVALEIPGEAPSAGPGDTLALAVVSGSGAARAVHFVRRLQLQRRTSATGQPATRVVADALLPPGPVTLALSRTAVTCNIADPATRFYRVGRSASRDADPQRPVLVLIHGWQGRHNNCADVDRFAPEQEAPWQSLVARYFSGTAPAGERLASYETWVMKYPTFQRVDFAASELDGFLRRFLPNRRIVIVGHSMGGLVAARYLARFSDKQVAHVVTLGTPFAGSPAANLERRDALRAALRECSFQQTVRESVGRLFLVDDSPGYLDLSDAASAFPRRTVLPSLAQDRSRITAFYGELADDRNHGSTAGNELSQFYGAQRCAIRALELGESDGLVTTASATANDDVGASRRLLGFDHSTIYGPRIGNATEDPQELLAVLLRDLAARHAPIVSLTVDAPTLQLSPGATGRVVATARDVEGFALDGRSIRWTSSNSAVAVIDANTGDVRAGGAPGTATLTATADGRTVSIALTVQTSTDNPAGPTERNVVAVISREPVGPREVVPYRMIVLNDQGVALERAQFFATVPGFSTARASTLPDSGRCGSSSTCSSGDGVTFASARVDPGQLRALALGFAVASFPTLPTAINVSGLLRSTTTDRGAIANGRLAVVETPVIAAEVDSSSYALGSTAAMVMRVANPAATALNGASVTLELPTDVQLVSAAPAPAVQGRLLTWSLAALASGGEQTLTLRVRLPNSNGLLVLTPELRSTALTTPLARARVVLPVTSGAALALQVSTALGTVAPNGALSATVVVRNRTTRTLTGVRVSMLVPDQTTARSSTIVAGGRCGTQSVCDPGEAITWPTTVIPAGGSLSYSIGYVVESFPLRRILPFEVVGMVTYDGGGAVHSTVVTRAR